MFYPQNDDRFVTTDSVTSLRPIYSFSLNRLELGLQISFSKFFFQARVTSRPPELCIVMNVSVRLCVRVYVCLSVCLSAYFVSISPEPHAQSSPSS